MATRKQKNTITNLYRLRSLEEFNNNPDTKLYSDDLGVIFKSKCLRDIVSETPPPVDLWHGLWHQGEMACLFGEPNVGKTILAMRMAADIIKRDEKVLYFDFENAEHQFLPRYKGMDDYGCSNAPAIQVLTLNHTNYDINHDNHSMLEYIKRACLLREAHILVIDDITHLFGTGSQSDVRYVLNTLRSWTKQFRFSILVLAHSKKKGSCQLADIEQLAGSFECAYSFDSIFSLNRANSYSKAKRGVSHYIKQHKTRMGEILYHDMNVMTLSLEFDDKTQSLTMCNLAQGGNERQLVRDFGYYTEEQIIEAVIDFKKKSFTIREIADMVGVSKSKVGRLLKEHYHPQEPQEDDFHTVPLPPLSTEPINPHRINPHEFIDRGEEALLSDDGAADSISPAYPPVPPVPPVPSVPRVSATAASPIEGKI